MSEFNNSSNTLASLSSLASLLAKPTIRNVWYNDKDVPLDGYTFVECRFDKCRLHLQGTDFTLERCFISADTQIFFGERGVRPIRLFHARDGWQFMATIAPYFCPSRDANGLITIKG